MPAGLLARRLSFRPKAILARRLLLPFRDFLCPKAILARRLALRPSGTQAQWHSGPGCPLLGLPLPAGRSARRPVYRRARLRCLDVPARRRLDGGIFAPAAAFAASPRRAEPSSAQATQAQQPVLPLVPVLENVKGISADEDHDAEGPRRGNFYSYREERKVPLDAPRSLWSTAPAIAWGVRRNKDLVASRSRER